MEKESWRDLKIRCHGRQRLFELDWQAGPPPQKVFNVQVEIRPAADLSATSLAQLVTESEQGGWRFVRRLVDGLHSGVNRFDREGECLFVAVSDEAVVGVCGLNIDPFVDDPSVGRVRRLYVLAAYRGSGVGQRLVQTVMSAAAGRFRCLRVRTSNPQAGRLYERLGFAPVTDVPDCTHILSLTEDESAPA